MTQSPRKEFDQIRDLINANRLGPARRRLSKYAPAALQRYDRGYYYFLLGRFDHLGGDYRVGNINKAIRLLEPFAASDDLYHWSLFLKGVIFRRSHQLRRAIPIFEYLERQAAKAGHFVVEASAVGQLAQHTAATGDIFRADTLFARAIDRYHFEEVRQLQRATIHNRAMWLARYGRFAEAEAIYLADPVSIEEWGVNLATSYTINRAFNLALRRRTKTALHMLQTYFIRGKADAAQDQIYHVNKGVTLLMAGQYGDALESLERALKIGQQSRHATLPMVYKWMAYCYLRLDDSILARRYARMTLKLGKRSGEVLEVGGAYFILGYADALESRLSARGRAREYMIMALSTFGDSDARWDLAMVQYRAAHLGLFPPRQSAQLVRLATRYFSSEGIKPPREKDDYPARMADAIKNLSDDDRNELLSLLDLD